MRLSSMLLMVLASPALAAPAPPSRAAEECAVFERELAFAQTVARHDAAAFADMLDPQAVFGAGGEQAQRGRDAVTQRWRGLVSGTAGRLEWYPERTTVAADTGLAWSTGPSLFEDLAPGARPRYRLGRFQSVWRRGADGEWRVLFDAGTAPQPATAGQAAAFRAARPRACPAG